MLQLSQDSGGWWHVSVPSQRIKGAVHPLCKPDEPDIHRRTAELGEVLPGGGRACRKCFAALGRAMFSMGGRLPEGK